MPVRPPASGPVRILPAATVVRIMPARLYRLRLGLPVGKTWIIRQIALIQEKCYPISPFSRTKSDCSVDRIWVKGQEDIFG
jgi:hypothetical protein